MLITFATAASRVTGFVRVVAVASALGTTYLANTYQTANTAPNVVFELVAAGVLTSIFVPTFVDYVVKGKEDEGWDAANALASVALVGLIALSIVVALAAPLIMRALTLGIAADGLRDRQIALGATFLRLFAPQIAFYGIGMIMTGALHAYRRFTMPAIAPIFNNVVVIVVYLTYAAMRSDRPPTVRGITSAETFVLGAGTTLGVIAMTLCLVPNLTRVGWRYRWNFNPSHPAVRRGAKLGAWALGYAGGYQAGLIVVLMLANRIKGGVAAYQWAYTFFYLPHALFAIPLFHVLFTAMSEHVARGETEGLIARLRDGLRMLAFMLLPTAAIIAAIAHPLTRATLDYGVMSGTGATLVARVLIGFVAGLPTYSMFLVFTRAFYAVGDTRTPTLVNAATVAIASIIGTLLFVRLDPEWAVPGLAVGHSIGFALGAVVLAVAFSRVSGSVATRSVGVSLVRSLVVSGLALGVMLAVHNWLPEDSTGEGLLNLVLTALAGGVCYVAIMRIVGAPELDRIVDVVRRERRA
jgi:putative peptidoglycan lipid II flippase